MQRARGTKAQNVLGNEYYGDFRGNLRQETMDGKAGKVDGAALRIKSLALSF